jgi:peptidoglycan-associated lipoprotein
MKLIKLLAVSMILISLSACSSLGMGKKEATEGVQAGDVMVEDRNAESSSIKGSQSDGMDVNGGAETLVIAGEGEYQGNELNDPASPLSNRTVYFDYDSSSVRQKDIATLEAHAAYLSANPNVTIRLKGHTDDRGSREYNLALGERRAIAIRQILMLQGASINQFQVTSYGEERLAAEGYDESVWQKNRRVELTYVGRE